MTVQDVRAGAVVVSGLRKQFGEQSALDGISMTVPQGAIYGFIGANGAGKTTALRILLGLARADDGRVRVLGVERGRLPATPIEGLSFCPDVPALYPWMTAHEVMNFAARFAGLERRTARERTTALLRQAGLDRVHGTVGGFSRGMRQRLGIAVALVSAPRLLILDEPTSALDPMGRRDVLELLKTLQGHTTVLFSSHLLGDVEEVCTHVGMIHAGKMLGEGTIDEVLGAGARGVNARHSQYRLAFRAEDPRVTITEARRYGWHVAQVPLAGDRGEPGAVVVEIRAGERDSVGREMPGVLERTGAELVSFDGVRSTLQDTYLALAQETKEGADED